jgi:ClpP class serine protease
MKLRELAATQGGTVWAMPRTHFEAVAEIEVGDAPQAGAPQALLGERAGVLKVERVGVVGLEGVIFSRVDLGRIMRSPEAFRRDVEQAIDDPELDAVVIDVRSPGGAI